MKSNEIRIGNIVGAGVLFDDDGNETGPMPSKILSIDVDQIRWTDDLSENDPYASANRTSIERTVGIPLTPDILDKIKGSHAHFFFQPIPETNSFLIQIGSIDIEVRGYIPIEHPSTETKIRISRGIRNVPKIQYLHQLQNLFFALTGEELNCQL